MMNKKIIFIIGILVIAVVLSGGCIHRHKPTTTTTTTLPSTETNCTKVNHHLDVIDLRGELTDLMRGKYNEKEKLLALSLQGIINRDSPKIYLLWESRDKFGNPSEECIEYYKSKCWITYDYISLDSALKKYADEVNGFVVYDPEFRHSINIATTLAGLNNTLIAHPDFISKLKVLGLPMKEDLRERWKDKYQAYEWQLENLSPGCNKNIIASGLPVEDPRTHKAKIWMARPIRDYVIMHRVVAVDLVPHRKVPKDYRLLERYYKGMNPYARVLGYPFTGALERPYVEFASKHGLIVVLAHVTSADFSVHSQMQVKTVYKQDHKTSVSFDPGKIYLAFAMSDLGLNSMQDRYYGAWDDPKRGNLPVNWWLDGVVKDFCPGIVQYYYETKTPNDYFYGAHVGGRIRPSDFPHLEEYLRRNKRYLEDCDLKTVAFSNHGKKDDYVFEIYSRVLDNCIGFFYGWTPTLELGEETAGNYWIFHNKSWIITSLGLTKDEANKADLSAKKISSFIDKNKKRPLFMTVLVILGNYPTVDFLEKIKNELDLRYPGEIEWIRGDELILVTKEHAEDK